MSMEGLAYVIGYAAMVLGGLMLVGAAHLFALDCLWRWWLKPYTYFAKYLWQHKEFVEWLKKQKQEKQ